MNLTTVRVHLVDDEPGVTRGLHWLLGSVGVEARRWQDPQAFLDAMRDDPAPACAVLDLRMPGLSGLDVLERLSRLRPELPVLFLSAHGDVGSAVQAMKLGAIDFLQKPFDPQVFLDGVARATRLAAARHAADERRRSRSVLLARLSAREREVLARLLAGDSSKRVARHLAISPRTVDVHRANILHKLEAPTLRELHARLREDGNAPAGD